MVSTIEIMLSHIKLLSRHLDCYNLRGAIIVVLMELKIPTNSIGYEFLKRAIYLQYQNPIRSLSKDIYKEIADECGLSSEYVIEQAIREAIKSAWRQGSKTAWDWYFAYDGQSISRRPTNSAFISKIAYTLELWQEQRKARGDRDERE